AKVCSISELPKERARKDCNETFRDSCGWVMTTDEIIAEGKYSPEHICNVDETGLFWKKMSVWAYIQKRLKQCPDIN
ncbi:hypothetical protein E2320_002259, partial [Naja naja]